MFEFPRSPVPEICISPAPDITYDDDEPESPFSCLSPKLPDEESYRCALLSPPPSAGSGRLSPLRPEEAPVKGQGLARERFEALLAASRDRNASVGAKKATDLRKEIALKQHKTKQVERRALFLSKVQAPPSPSAADLPKTPPESPAIFHYTLPSPGLVSPLALFESIANEDPKQGVRKSWVEQVDFRLPEGTKAKTLSPSPPSPRNRRQRSIPSLDEITARMSAQGHVSITITPPKEQAPAPARRLPEFLSRRTSPPPIIVTPVEEKPRRTLPIGVGRLQMPVRSERTKGADPLTMRSVSLMPKSPKSPMSPKLRVTTTVVPRTSSTSPVDLNDINLATLNSRARMAKDMLSTLRRRVAPGSSHDGRTGHDEEQGDGYRRPKRHSAPSELPRRDRCGFMHPILSLPGAF